VDGDVVDAPYWWQGRADGVGRVQRVYSQGSGPVS